MTADWSGSSLGSALYVVRPWNGDPRPVKPSRLTWASGGRNRGLIEFWGTRDQFWTTLRRTLGGSISPISSLTPFHRCSVRKTDVPDHSGQLGRAHLLAVMMGTDQKRVMTDQPRTLSQMTRRRSSLAHAWNRITRNVAPFPTPRRK